MLEWPFKNNLRLFGESLLRVIVSPMSNTQSLRWSSFWPAITVHIQSLNYITIESSFQNTGGAIPNLWSSLDFGIHLHLYRAISNITGGQVKRRVPGLVAKSLLQRGHGNSHIYFVSHRTTARGTFKTIVGTMDGSLLGNCYSHNESQCFSISPRGINAVHGMVFNSGKTWLVLVTDVRLVFSSCLLHGSITWTLSSRRFRRSYRGLASY